MTTITKSKGGAGCRSARIRQGAEKYVDIEQITIVVLSESDGGEPQIIAAWNCSRGDTANVIDIDDDIATAAIVMAQGD